MRYFDIRNDTFFLSFYEEFECESYLFMIDFRIFLYLCTVIQDLMWLYCNTWVRFSLEMTTYRVTFVGPSNNYK